MPTDKPKLVIVVGSGRSGTSTVAGALKYLGLRIPAPELPANRANPRGFFEPRWVVDFHKSLLTRADVMLTDARPQAFELCATAGARPQARNELRGWLRTQVDDPTAMVIKDPRTSWFQPLWREAAVAEGLAPDFLMMLRHPAEVAGSKQSYYGRKDAEQRAGDTVRTAAWINVQLGVEYDSRQSSRVIVRYHDLLGDWRPAMQSVQQALDLELNTDLSRREEHPVDSFIDPSLRRVRQSWDEVDVPDSVRDIAEESWVQLNRLVDAGGRDETIERELDSLRAQFGQVHADAERIAGDAVRAATRRGRRQGRRAAAKSGKPPAGKRPRGPEPEPSTPKPESEGGARSVGHGPGERIGRTADGLLRRVRSQIRRG